MSFPSGFSKYQEVTIDHTKVSADLTDYVVYIDLANLVKAGADIFDTCRSDGGDIRATKSDGTTQLATELVAIDTTAKTGELHVKFTGTLSSSVDTIIRIWYNGTDTALAVSDTYGRNAVWSDYVAVYHFESDDTNSTGGTAATDTSVTYSSGNGLFGNGGGFNGSSSKIYTNINLGSNPTFSVSLWEKSSYAGTNYINLMTLCDQQTSNTGTQIYFFLEGSTDYMAAEGGGVNLRPASGNDAITGNWTHGVWQQDYGANQSKIYFNGSLQDTDVKHSSTFNNWMRISIFGNNAGFFDGSMDEIKVRASYLSANWITTEYNNQNSPSTFYSAGSEQGGSGGGYTPVVSWFM